MGMLAVSHRSKTEGETIRATFGQSCSAGSSGAEYLTRLSPKQGDCRHVNVVEPVREWSRDGTESDSGFGMPYGGDETGWLRRWC